MMRKFLFLILLVLLVVGVLYAVGQQDVRLFVDATLARFRQRAVEELGNRNVAVTRAQALLKQRIAEGDNLSHGPCLAENLIINWSADIVHDPRTASDDLPANQCRWYREGSTKHLVEITEDGKIVSTK